MIRSLLVAFGVSAAATLVPITAVAEVTAPPLFNPAVARDVADACPGTERYAAALVTGITLSDADVAAPLFASCAARIRLDGYAWKAQAAQLALAALDVARGLAGDPARLRAAADVTAELRGRSLATDGDVERWRVIPDRFDEQRNEPIVYDTVLVPPLNAEQTRNVFHGADRWIANAAYLNVAARKGRAWITTPRTSNVAVGGGSGFGTRWTRPSLGTDHYPTGSEEVTRQGS